MRNQLLAFLRYAALAFLLSVVMLWLGSRARYRFERRLGLNPVERLAFTLANLPADLKRIWQDPALVLNPGFPKRPDKPDGPLAYVGSASFDSIPSDKLLVLNTFSPAESRYTTLLYDMAAHDTVRSWRVPYERLQGRYEAWRDSFARERYPNVRFDYVNAGRASAQGLTHSLPLPGGKLLAQVDFAPLFCLDSAGNVLWQTETLIHHAVEPGEPGRLWACSIDPDSKSSRLYEDAIVQVDTAGEVLFSRRVSDVFRANPDHDYSRFNFKDRDPYHLNDVQPVLRDSEKGYWKRGDLFLSFRHLSAVMLYRPSSDEVVWSKCTGWHYQHDVEIVNDSVISVYDNDVGRDHSRMVFYDFSKDTAYAAFTEPFERYDVASETQGRGKFFPADSLLFLESTEDGFLIFEDLPTGRSWRCVVPGDRPGKVGSLAWCRLLERGDWVLGE